MATLQKEKDKMEEKLKMFEQLNENMRVNLQMRTPVDPTPSSAEAAAPAAAS